MILRSEVIAGLLGSASVKLFGAVLGFAVVVILARSLGPGEYGVYAWVMALTTLLAVPVQLGLPTLLLRETARAQQQGDWGGLKGLWRWSSLVVMGVALALGLAALGGMFLFSERVGPSRFDVLWWGLFLVPLVAWSNLAGAGLMGLRRVVLGQLPENILRPGLLLILLLIVYQWRLTPHLSAAAVMAMTLLAALLSMVAAAVLLRLNRPVELSAAKPAYRPRIWCASMWPLALLTGMHLINSYTDILMLGLFASDEVVGIYRVVVQSAALVVFILQIVNSVVAPHFARLHAAGQLGELQRLITRSARITLFGALPVMLVLLVFGSSILRWVFGTAYDKGYEALAILAVAQLINAGMGSVAFLLNMTGHERDTAKGVAAAALVNVTLNLAMIPKLGMNGAALATAVSLAAWNFILWRAVRVRLGLNSTAFTFGNTTKLV